jgi:hypothetical protein
MLRALLNNAIIVGVVLTPFAGKAAQPFELKSTTVQFPESDRLFPNGPRSDVINVNCLICHSAGMVLNQPRLTTEAWAAEVNKMINVYKAPVAPADVGPIVDYLTSIKIGN